MRRRSYALLVWFAPAVFAPYAMAACGSDSSTPAAAEDAGGDATTDAGGGADTGTDVATSDGGGQTDSAVTDAGTDAAGDAADASDAAMPCSLDGGPLNGLTCDGKCVDVAADPNHCGSCETKCNPGFICSSGCVDVAGSLSGLRWELPCLSSLNAQVCVTKTTQTQVATLSGVTGVFYDVTLHFRGIVEQKTYTGGGAPDGGLADGGTNAGFYLVGATPAVDDWNVYKLEVSEPAYTAFLNNGTSGHYYVDALDYTVTVRMKAGASVTLTANPSDNGPYEIKNMDIVDGGAIVVPGIAPAPAAFDGQFVQMDVTSVTVAP